MKYLENWNNKRNYVIKTKKKNNVHYSKDRVFSYRNKKDRTCTFF